MKKRIIAILFIIILIPGLCFSGMAENYKRVIARKRVASVSAGVVGSINHPTTRTLFNNTIYETTYTATAGEVRYGHIYMSTGNSVTICLILSDASGLNIANASGTAPAGSGWLNLDAGSPVVLTATNYILGVSGSSGNAVCGTWAGPDNTRAEAYTTCSMNIDPGSSATATQDLTIVWNNSSGDPE